MVFENCCGKVMRGPTSGSKSFEENDVSLVSADVTMRDSELLPRGHHVTCSRTTSNASSCKNENDGGTPIWKVGRILMDSLSKGKMRRSKMFGTPLEDLPLNCQGMPKIAHRLCLFLEQYGLTEPGLFETYKKHGKIVERFKISFDRAGDADLESCNDVKVIASLFKLWLHDLPHPLIPQRITVRLTTILQKYERKEIYDLNIEISNMLVTCPALNLGVLYTVMRLLFLYFSKWYPSAYIDQLSDTFAKILIGDNQIEHVEIITTLIHNFGDIFNERVLERAFKLYLINDRRHRNTERVRECGNQPLAVNKLPRSNSEEKLNIENDHNLNLWKKSLNMRRVNSHEDFSESQHNSCRPVQVLVVNTEQGNNFTNSRNDFPRYRMKNEHAYRHQYDEPVVDNFKKIAQTSDKEFEVLVAPFPFNLNADSEIQEKIRNEERFTPQMYRNIGRRKRAVYKGHTSKPKIQAVFEDDLRFSSIKPWIYRVEDAASQTFLTESPLSDSSISQDSDSQSFSSTSSSSSSDTASSGIVSITPEPSQCLHDFSEPVTRFRNWNSTHRYLKTNSSNVKYSFADGIGATHATHLSSIDMKILQVHKHLQWIKKKMKHFEEEFECKFGETPTIRNKMSHPEYKHMSTTVIYLKNNLKHLRKKANESFSAYRLHVTKNPNNSFNLGLCSSPLDKGKAVREAEKQLREKRILGGRPEYVKDMTYEQLQDEKVSIQKELLHLESMYGQTVARNEELFKPIYIRYRTVKRFLARSMASLKQKDLIGSDLITILENETIEFDLNNTIGNNISENKYEFSMCKPLCNMDDNLETSNIHELSSPELMMEYKKTKEEKRKLRNRIYMYEQEAENRTFNDTKHCIHSLRSRYKNTKAKLKLLEALLMKQNNFED